MPKSGPKEGAKNAPKTLLDSIDSLIERYHLLKHPFYQAWIEGKLSKESLQLYAAQYYQHVRAFPENLKQLASRTNGNLQALVKENLAEEVEDLARSERRQLESRLEVLLQHLLKCQFQPKRRSCSWTATIAVQRFKIRRHLEQNPGLRPAIPEILADAYTAARIDLINSVLQDATSRPFGSCPWTFEQIMNEQFRPD